MVERPALGATLDGVASPPSAKQAEHFFQHVASPGAIEPERLALPRLAEAVTKLSNSRPLEI
jgi:hypothetical protein